MYTNLAFRASVDFSQEPHRNECFEKLQPAYAALDPKDLIQVNKDLPAMGSTILEAIPAISHIDNLLETEAYALCHAHSVWSSATKASDYLAECNAEAVLTRDRFYYDIRALCQHGVLPFSCLDNYIGLTGFKNVATDLLLFTALYVEHFDKIQGKCATTREEVDRAEHLGTYILRQYGARQQPQVRVETAADNRVRAFTLVFNYYDTVRRGVSYLRWKEGDVESIAPSLYGGYKRSAQEPEEPEVPTVETTPGTPATGATGPTTPAASPTANPALKPSAEVMPGGNPFLR